MTEGAVRRAGRAALGMVALGLAAGACGAGADDASASTELTVFAAASLTDVFAEIGEAFEQQAPGGVEVTFNFGASSSLREQILGGAPADVFASASPGPMQELVDAGEVGAPETFARNRLAVVVPVGNPGAVASLEDLADGDLLVGLCAPEVPCGSLARTVLDDAGVAVAPDTEEPDVRALLTKVVEGELDAGLVYVTDARAAGDEVESIDISDGGSTDYPIAVVRRSGDASAAARFVDFVQGAEAQRILADAGFDVG